MLWRIRTNRYFDGLESLLAAGLAAGLASPLEAAGVDELVDDDVDDVDEESCLAALLYPSLR